MSILPITQVNLPPGMIDLGVGQPGFDLLPLKVMQKAVAHWQSRDDATYLAYGAEQGEARFRASLARFLSAHYRSAVTPEHLLVTAGTSQGLDLICTLYAKPGDTIFVEEPSYFLALRIFADHHLNVIGLPVDGEGLMIDALEEALQQHKPAFLYTVPTFHNPTALTLPAHRREQLVDLSRRYRLLVIADEVYHLLAYNKQPPAPLAQYPASESIISLGSFSKILAPGLRLGWIQANPGIIQRFTGCGMLDSGGGLNPFTSGVVRSALETGLQDAHLSFLLESYSERKQALLTALQKRLSTDFLCDDPGGGFFVWLRLPDGMDAEQLLITAREHHVGFLPGIRCSSRRGLQNYIRLSFAFYDPSQLQEAVDRLARVLQASI
jgi:DNA-binding transcriptional MocR family regulator